MAYTVLGGSQILPPGYAKNRWYNDMGQIQGHAADLLVRALIGQMGSGNMGQVPTTPSAQHPGSFNFPQGSQSPGEAAQISRLGGVPTQQGFMAPATQQPGMGGVTYQPPTKWGNLQTQLNQLKIQELQRQLDPQSPENQLKKSQASMYSAYAGQLAGVNQSSGGGYADKIVSLKQRALQGDETAITVLTELGEL